LLVCAAHLVADLGLPEYVLDLATFGRITTMSGAPRILSFSLNYGVQR
jgi:hypothetical protein